MLPVSIFVVVISISYVNSAKLDINAIGLQTFKGMDTNHDGTVQESEISSAINSFDTNGDNVISCQEYIGASTLSQAVSRQIYDFYDNECTCSLKFAYVKSLFLGMDDDADNMVTQKEFVKHFTEVLAIIDGTDPQARQILSCKALINMAQSSYKSLDTDHDNNFTTVEQIAFLSGIDANGDTNITCHEYIIASTMPRNLSRTIFFNVDKDGDCSMTQSEILTILSSYDADGDNAISEQEFQTSLIKMMKLLQHATNNQQPHGQNMGNLSAITHTNFVGIDRNSDGQIDSSEWDTVITALDLNGDQNVTCHEYFTVSAFPPALSRAIFVFSDVDSDCSIPHDDLLAVAKNADGDGDGLVSETELKANLQQVAQAIQRQSN